MNIFFQKKKNDLIRIQNKNINIKGVKHANRIAISKNRMEDDYVDYENDDGMGNIILDDDELIDEEEEDEFENENVNDSETSCLECLEETERKTKPFMTKYEYCVIRGIRLKQLSKGAVTFANYQGIQKLSINEIFDLEFNQKCIPLIIKRRLPNNKYELWKCSELDSTFLYREDKML